MTARHHAVIEGEGQRHDAVYGGLSVDGNDLFGNTARAQNGDLRRHDDKAAETAGERAVV